jgi:O-antigen ligase
MALAVVFSLSRSGMITLLLTLLFMAIAVGSQASRGKLAIALAGVFLALAGAGILWLGPENVLQRYGELLQDEAALRGGRLLISRDTLNLIRAHPLGIGAGKYQDIFRQYQTLHLEALFDHAHNDYLEITAEWGIPVGFAFWLIVFLILILTVRAFGFAQNPERQGVTLACAGAIFAILTHSATDFNLQIPSNAMLFFSFLGIGLRAAGTTTRNEK